MTAAGMSWGEVGDRIRASRLAVGLSQAQLAEKVGLQRSMITKIEAGDREVDALELYRLADALSVSLAHLVSRPPAAIVSHRAALSEAPDQTGRLQQQLDIALEQHARAVAGLVEVGSLVPPSAPFRANAATPDEAREAARSCRQHLGLGNDALPPLADTAEGLGLYLVAVPLSVDGASLSEGSWGAAVVGALSEPGRRRMTAAHELGHHVLGDEYSSDVGIAASRQDRESVVDAFAAEFLLPQDAVTGRLRSSGDVAAVLTAIAAEYRASWTVVVRTALRSGVPGLDARALEASAPTHADFVRVVGTPPTGDLQPGSTGSAYRRAVMDSLDRQLITPARAGELLHGLLDSDTPAT